MTLRNTVDRALDVFEARQLLETWGGKVAFYDINALEAHGYSVSRLPYSIKVMLEAALRQVDGVGINVDDVMRYAAWQPNHADCDVPYLPARVVLQDFAGVPSLVDLAAMRAAIARHGGDPARINPAVPVDLVIDHSVQVDRFGSTLALAYNTEREFERNRERYEFLRWGQQALSNFRVVPPAMGIVHQVNLEYLSTVVQTRPETGGIVAFPDTLVANDSHATMINGLGILGWGVGGIEAEAVMLGQPISMLLPEVIGVHIAGELENGATATDLVLTITELLRSYGVVGKFVEFFGSGVGKLSLADRATIANMSPEYGATISYFPVDDETLSYLRNTGRSSDLVDLVERYTKEQGLFRTDVASDIPYTDVLHFDLSIVEPSIAGPRRPQDRIPLSRAKAAFTEALPGFERQAGGSPVPIEVKGRQATLSDGAVILAAITSCTNTSNPSVMVGAGLLARRAVEKDLAVPPYVKTSLAPGSRVVMRYLDEAGLTPYLETLGFHVVGYGCTTCVGNSGPIDDAISAAVKENDLVVAAVLSGNRNFEGRVHPLTRANYLASPPLVVAFALAGRADIDFEHEPLGYSRAGEAVYLRDIWPSQEEINAVLSSSLKADMFESVYSQIFDGNEMWNAMPVIDGQLYPWNPDSTYIKEPPFFLDLDADERVLQPVTNARALVVLGDSLTTDHISPAGAISADSPAGHYLIELGITPDQFNQYGARRGNHEVMMRGTFANIRLQNKLAAGKSGSHTRYFPASAPQHSEGEAMSIYDAAMRYRAEGTPLVVLAGKEYGTGSSRDWAAKGTALLGVKAVLAESFERIHRSNLVGMGVLPLEFLPGQTLATLGLTGCELYDIDGIDENFQPRQVVTVRARGANGASTEFQMRARIDTPIEISYFRNGGILQTVLRSMLAAASEAQ